MTAKAAAGFTLRTHKGIERGGGLLPALGAALLAAGACMAVAAWHFHRNENEKEKNNE